MAAPKEPPMAFEPTPNDALHASAVVSNASNGDYSAAANRDDVAILSPSPGSTSSTPLYPGAAVLPERSSVTSASDMPSAVGAALKSPFDQQHWFNLYNDVVEARRRDQEIWARERIGLRQEIDSLKAQLSRIPDAMRHGSATNGTSGDLVDKFAFNESMVQHATEKLRQLSVISPASTRRSSNEPSESYNNGPRRASSQQRTPAIPANGPLDTISEVVASSPEKQVKVAMEPEEITVTPSVPGQSEDPFSPAPTASLSPPPPSYLKHAGHTPLMARSNRTSFVEEDDESKKNARENLKLTDPSNVDGLDEDPELIGEKILPTTPDDPSRKGQIMLNELNSKLNDVASNPEGNVPMAIHMANVLESQESRTDKQNGSGSDKVNPPGADGNFGGVKLRMKRSTNFGAPLGSFQ